MSFDVKPVIKKTLVNYFDLPEDLTFSLAAANDEAFFDYALTEIKGEADELRKFLLGLGHLPGSQTYERAINIIVYAQLLLAAIEEK